MSKYTFARRLKQLMKERGLTQYALAKKAGVTRQSVSYLLSGEREPNWTTVRLLARAMDISVADFDAEDDDPKRPEKGGKS